MPKPIDLTATMTLTASAGEGRTIKGEIVRYGEVGLTSFGPTIFEPGSIEVHADLARVKLLEMHDQERSIGYLKEYDDGPQRMTGGWQVAQSEAGNLALQGVKDKTRDALSLGVQVLEYAFSDNDELIVKAAKLNEVSLVTIPAFSESRVESIAAMRKELTDMPKDVTNPVTEVKPGDAPQPEPTKVQAGQGQQNPPAQPAVTPIVQAEQVAPTQVQAGISLEELAGQIASGGQRGQLGTVLAKANPRMFVTAALTDVLPADDAGLAATGVSRPQWVGELWQARRVERPTIDSVTQQQLTSMKGYGYRKVYPAPTDVPAHFMNEYAGSKAAVPASAKIKTEPAEWAAKRWAGGWDVDRAYFDFGDREFIQVTLAAAYDDYLQQTEAALVAAMLAAGAAVAATDPIDVLTKLGAQAAELGSSISKIQFAPDIWAQFVTLNSAEVPWWLRNQGSINLGTVDGNAGNLSFNVNHELPAGKVLAHDKRAVTHRETPIINVTAENIPNGGVDLGVFGYTSHTINDARAVFTGTVAAAAPAA